ncbi:MAG TPA: hypothetical protein VMF06_03150 [Candidatus Limnocylindria bacterium]|jgi:hypothetical protein|nr:hypothetical protein [Candidatus Limnocylindria bacterium]
MLERFEKPLRLACLVLGAILVLQLAMVVARKNPLAGLKIPEIPTLANSASNTPAVDSKSGPVTSGPKGPAISTSTNASGLTNSVGATDKLLSGGTNNISTNASPALSGTNTESAGKSTKPATNAIVSAPPPHPPRGGPGMPGMPGTPGAGPPLPPLVQARIDRIIQSEMLAPIIRPQPMALLGIAGPDVFLRTATGQTGMVKEGAELGGVKVLRIGMNRVLVEENGEKKELTIFSGFGSESLLPKQNEKSK